MQAYTPCLPCLLTQAVTIAERHLENESRRNTAVQEVLTFLGGVDMTQPPPVIAARVHTLLRRHIGVDDFFAADKPLQNELALSLLPMMRRRVEQADDPFSAAVTAGIAGNAIDLGIYHHMAREEMEQRVRELLEKTPDEEAVASLKEQVRQAEKILFIADNAGEIVFDRLLVEQLPLERVTVGVKGKPVLNDAMYEDAEAAGLTDLVRVIDNGSAVPGTWLEDCSPAFRQAFDNADLVIAKGQGNFETLEQLDKTICFLVLLKCPVIATFAGARQQTPAVLWAAAHHKN